MKNLFTMSPVHFIQQSDLNYVPVDPTSEIRFDIIVPGPHSLIGLFFNRVVGVKSTNPEHPLPMSIYGDVHTVFLSLPFSFLIGTLVEPSPHDHLPIVGGNPNPVQIKHFTTKGTTFMVVPTKIR